MIPLGGWPFATIMRIWIVILWILLLAMTAYAWSYARAPSARAAVIIVASLFLLTNAWELHTKYGETYLLISALAMAVLALWRWPFLAGCAAAVLVMVRPNAVLFIVPFLAVRGLKWSFILPGVIAVGWVLLSPRERGLWGDYERMLGEQVKIHQDLGPATRPAVTDPRYPYWEGLDMDTVRARIARDPVRIYSENGNVFVLYRQVHGRRMPVLLLAVLGGAAILLVVGALIVVRQRFGEPDLVQLEPDLARLAIIGFCLYMISDLFSPIYRHAYYGAQWIMPLLLAASLYRGRLTGRSTGWYIGLLAALLLNIVHLPFIRMGNTIGEYGFLVCLLGIGFAQRWKT
jgi:hypothetical protein